MFSRQRNASSVPRVPRFISRSAYALGAEDEIGELDQHPGLQVGRERRGAGEGEQHHERRLGPETRHAAAGARWAIGVSFTGRLRSAATMPRATEIMKTPV